jgi:hypothetical protein
MPPTTSPSQSDLKAANAEATISPNETHWYQLHLKESVQVIGGSKPKTYEEDIAETVELSNAERLHATGVEKELQR